MNHNGYTVDSTNPGGSRPYTWVTHKEMIEHTENIRRDINEQLLQLWREIRDIRTENQKRATQTIWLLTSILIVILLNLVFNIPINITDVI